MESVYKASLREWVSKRVYIEGYFNGFREVIQSSFLSDLTEDGAAASSVATNFTPLEDTAEAAMSSQGNKLLALLDDTAEAAMTQENKLLTLLEDTAGAAMAPKDNKLLKDFCSPDRLTCPGEIAPLDSAYYMGRMRRQLREKPVAATDSSLKTLQYLRKEGSKYYLKYTRTIWLNIPAKQPEEVTSVEEDLKEFRDYVLMIKIYDPYDYTVRDVRYVHCGKQYMFLPSHTLATLRDQIVCLNDLNIPTDVSENPDQPPAPVAKDVFKSNFIYMEGIFYIDSRDGSSTDTTQEIRDWAKKSKIGDLRTASMEETELKSLTIRFGFPYVYQHQGDCEHLIIFHDARFMNRKDLKYSEQYPIFTSTDTKKDRKCFMCARLVARWATVNSNRIVNDPFYWCEECFRSYNYKDGVKVGKFRAFAVTDKCVQLI